MKLFTSCPHKTWDKDVQKAINDLMDTYGEIVILQWACRDCLIGQAKRDPALCQMLLGAGAMCARCGRIPKQKDSEYCPTCQAITEEEG